MGLLHPVFMLHTVKSSRMLPEAKPKAAALFLGMDLSIVQYPIETPKPYSTTEAANDSWAFVCQFREERASVCMDSPCMLWASVIQSVEIG